MCYASFFIDKTYKRGAFFTSYSYTKEARPVVILPIYLEKALQLGKAIYFWPKLISIKEHHDDWFSAIGKLEIKDWMDYLRGPKSVFWQKPYYLYQKRTLKTTCTNLSTSKTLKYFLAKLLGFEILFDNSEFKRSIHAWTIE